MKVKIGIKPDCKYCRYLYNKSSSEILRGLADGTLVLKSESGLCEVCVEQRIIKDAHDAFGNHLRICKECQ